MNNDSDIVCIRERVAEILRKSLEKTEPGYVNVTRTISKEDALKYADGLICIFEILSANVNQKRLWFNLNTLEFRKGS